MIKEHLSKCRHLTQLGDNPHPLCCLESGTEGFGLSLTNVDALRFPIWKTLPENATGHCPNSNQHYLLCHTTLRSAPKKPKQRIPPSEWPTVVRRITENHEPLRTVAHDYEVSHETVRRVLLASRNRNGGERLRRLTENQTLSGSCSSQACM